jgi:uncharacterized membrane protein
MIHSNTKQRFLYLSLCYVVFLALDGDGSNGTFPRAQAFSMKMRRAKFAQSLGHYSSHISSTRKNSPWSSSSACSLHLSLKMASSSADIVPGIGEAGCKLRAPSGVNTMNDSTQAAVSLGLCTTLFNALLSSMTINFEWFHSFRYSWPIVLGLVFVAAGVTHFTLADEYKNIYPYQGAWGGLWKLPGSADFHVAWTGLAELVGGLGLLAGGLIHWLAPPFFPSSLTVATSAGLESDCAAALYFLTWAVTPANVFMFTHGAKLPMGVEGSIPIRFHVVRFVMQVVLLGFLYQLGEGTFEVLSG